MILKMKPTFVNKIWGGDKLSKLFPTFEINKNQNIGEAWLISAYFEKESLIIDKNQTLSQFYKQNPILFNNYDSEEFPLLVKIIDAKDDLSIQVHPDDQKAQELENYPFGKSEAWYILDVSKPSKIIIGTKISDKNIIKNKIIENNWNEILCFHSISKGDFFEIKPGTLHAILKNTLIYEIQQSSDITYRFFDYNRLDENGNKRSLDVEKSLEVLNAQPFVKTLIENQKIPNKIHTLIDNDKFSLLKLEINDNFQNNFPQQQYNFLLITCIDGKGTINNMKINQYDSWIMTLEEIEFLKFEGKFILLIGFPK